MLSQASIASAGGSNGKRHYQECKSLPLPNATFVPCSPVNLFPCSVLPRPRLAGLVHHSGGEGTVQPFQFPTPQEFASLAASDLAAIGLVEAPATPSTGLETEYLMTLYVPLERPLSAADNLKIWNIRSQGSWLSGPGIKAKIVNPSGDWARVLPGGQIRVDVRLTLETEDAQIIFMSYNGIVQLNGDALPRLMRGEAITAQDAYFVIAPTFETRSEKYSWLNGVQAVGKMVSFKRGDDSHVQYEVFRVK